MGEGSGRGLDRVESDFLSAIAGRVNVSPGRVGSKKSDPWTTLSLLSKISPLLITHNLLMTIIIKLKCNL